MSRHPADEDSWDEGDGEPFAFSPGDAEANGSERWPERESEPWSEDDPERFGPQSGRWPLDPRGLYPRERWLWYEQLWTDACMLRDRYRLALRAGWWADEIQIEAVAALAAWVERYDSGEWDDPPGKLALLYDLERVGLLLRDGLEPFHPARDRDAFLLHLVASGCQPPPTTPEVEPQ